MSFYQALDYLSIGVVFVMMGYIGVEYATLPQYIPTHFSLTGIPNHYSKKEFLFILPILGIILYLIMNWVARNPTSPLLNIPTSLRKNSSTTQIILRSILLITILILFNITYESIEISKGNISTLSHISNLLIILLITTILGGTWYYNKRKN